MSASAEQKQQVSSAESSNPATVLGEMVRQAVVAAFGDSYAETDPLIRGSQNPEFGDYQSNCAMGLAKRVGANPREVATKIVEAIDTGALSDPPEIAGPGFMNFRLRPSALATLLGAMDDDRLGIEQSTDSHSVVIDMCSVNVAKQMHVGHLRSTIIGDAIARVFEREGRVVYRENHLGDWGLPIAMVLHQLRASGADLDRIQLPELDQAYREAQLTGRADGRGLDAARRLHAGPHRIAELEAQNAGAEAATTAAKTTLVALQRGDEELVRDWNKLINCTLSALFEAIDILGVDLGPENNRGESFYRDRLDGVIDAFVEQKLAREDAGALVVDFDDRDRPMLIRKSDGGFLYATTDLAAVRFRTSELNAGRIIYVVDARQRDHFRDVFDAVRKIGWDRTPDERAADLVHIGFGTVLGPDKKPLKTRSGKNITLRSLLEEACERGQSEVHARAEDPNAPTHGLDAAELDRIGQAVGIAAVKYADLSTDLVRDYIFDMDNMIRFEGNTGPYLQYAHARVCSILRRAEEDGITWSDTAFAVAEPAEKALAMALLKYGEVVSGVGQSLEPHRLCSYLYDLANAYSSFYQNCPVLKVEGDLRSGRLRLCDLTRRVLSDGLGLLGITAPDRM